MLDLIFIYLSAGGLVIFFINALYYTTHHPLLSFVENIICLLLWPAVIKGCVEGLNEN